MRAMEKGVLIHVNSFLGQHRDNLYESQEAIPELSGILRARHGQIELLLEVQ